jgi:hypothetical protein
MALDLYSTAVGAELFKEGPDSAPKRSPKDSPKSAVEKARRSPGSLRTPRTRRLGAKVASLLPTGRVLSKPSTLRANEQRTAHPRNVVQGPHLKSSLTMGREARQRVGLSTSEGKSQSREEPRQPTEKQGSGLPAQKLKGHPLLRKRNALGDADQERQNDL